MAMITRRTILGALAAAPLAVGSSRSQGASTEARPIKRGPRAGYFPNATLYTHTGRPVKFYDDLVAGKVVAFNVIYTGCNGICPLSTANLRLVHESLGDHVGRDIFMYSLTIEPERDTPRVLRTYMRRYGVNDRGWTFLTGSAEDIKRVRTRLGFYDIDERVDNERTTHTGMVRIGNEALDRWCMQPVAARPKQIARTILRMLPARTRAIPAATGLV
jgi:protein SCO1/2